MSRHTIDTCLGMGDPDLGAEADLRIAYTFLPGSPATGPTYASGGEQASPDEIEFVSCVQLIDGKEHATSGMFGHLEQSSLDAIAEAWLLGDEGHGQAVENALDDLADQHEQAAEMRADR